MRMTMLLLWIAMFTCVGGCGQEDVARVRCGAASADDVSAAGPATESAFGAEIVLCRRVGSKTGKRIAVGDSFAESPEKKNRYIHAFVDFNGAPVGLHQIHLVWIKPGDRKLFRKFAEVRVTPTSDGYVTETAWLKTEDLHYRQVEEPVAGPTTDFSLHTKLNVTPGKERGAGEYTLRVYWNRELLVEKTFLFHTMDN